MFIPLFTSILFVVVATEPQGCCVPWTHSFTLLEAGGSLTQGATAPSIDDDIIDFNADYHNVMESMVIHRLDRTTNTRGNITIMNFYKNSTRYVLRGNGSCLKQHLSTTIQPRCTANYTYSNSFTVGSGNNTIAVNSWTIAYPNANAHLTVTITDDGECTPISQTNYGLSDDRKSQFLTAMLYANFQMNVQNSDKFILPASCDMAASIPVGKRALGDDTSRNYHFLL